MEFDINFPCSESISPGNTLVVDNVSNFFSSEIVSQFTTFMQQDQITSKLMMAVEQESHNAIMLKRPSSIIVDKTFSCNSLALNAANASNHNNPNQFSPYNSQGNGNDFTLTTIDENANESDSESDSQLKLRQAPVVVDDND